MRRFDGAWLHLLELAAVVWGLGARFLLELGLGVAVVVGLLVFGWPGNWPLSPELVEVAAPEPARRGVLWFGGEPEG